MTISSPAFADGATIPKRFTCAGEGSAPTLELGRVPAKTRELALLVQDADANWFVHWAVLHIPPGTRSLRGTAPPGAVELKNDFGKRGWGAPCPPKGDKPHRYLFGIYALNARVDDRGAIAKHALAAGTLTGRFSR